MKHALIRRELLLIVLPIFLGSCDYPMRQSRIALLQENYVRLTSEKNGGSSTFVYSGVRVSDHEVLTVYHGVRDACVTSNSSGVSSVGKVIEYRVVEDVALVYFETPFLSPPLHFGKAVQGQKAYALTSAMRYEAVYLEFIVAKVEKDRILLTPTPPIGSSGAGIYNEGGDCIGMIIGFLDRTEVDDIETLGVAVSSETLQAFMKARGLSK